MARPDEASILEALARILASDSFARSDRARKLIDYLVRTELAGQADRLKGFAVAVDVFGKDGDFDPSTDAVVRVQAGRLRDLLETYYASEGAGDALRIVVPRGTYVPVYVASGTHAAPDEPSVALDPARMGAAIGARFGDGAPPVAPSFPGFVRVVYGNFRLMRAAGLVMLALLAFVAWAVGQRAFVVRDPAVAQAIAVAPVAAGDALPSILLVDASEGNRRAADLHAALHAALPAFDAIAVSTEPEEAGIADDDNVFVVRVLPGADAETALVQVDHPARSKHLFSTTLASAPADARADQLAGLMTQLFPVGGTIYAYLAENDLAGPLPHCLILENRFFLDLGAAEHRAAYDCFAALAKDGAKSPLVHAELANLEMAAVTGRLDYPVGASIERAIALARRAVELGPSSPTAFRAEGYALARSGDVGAGLRWTRQAAALNPNDMSLAASAGNVLVMAGDYGAAAALLARATRIAPVHPHWWDYALYLAATMTGDTATAWSAADALVGSNRRHYLAARLVAAAGRGAVGQAGELAGRLRAEAPDFAADPKAALLRAGYPADLAERLAGSIVAALAAGQAS